MLIRELGAEGEKVGFISQVRRSVVKIPSNITEGHECGASLGKTWFVNILKGYLFEFDTQIIKQKFKSLLIGLYTQT